MILTIEAKSKWCPMVRASEGSGDSAANRMASNPDENGWDFAWAKCIADKCMMWEWDREPRLTCTRRDSEFLIKNQPEYKPNHLHDYEIEEENERSIREYFRKANEAIQTWEPPTIEGWEFVSKGMGEEDDYWGCFVATYKRDVDPTATGYCGLSRKRIKNPLTCPTMRRATQRD